MVEAREIMALVVALIIAAPMVGAYVGKHWELVSGRFEIQTMKRTTRCEVE